MNCMKCGADMFKAGLQRTGCSDFLMLHNRKKGLLEVTKYSSVSCYVCPACGHVELQADNPGALIINGTSIFEEDEQ